MLDHIISDEGYPVAWIITPAGAKYNQVFQSKQALIDAIPVLDQQNEVVYFGVGTVTDPNPPKVKRFVKGQEVRKQNLRVETNIHSFKSLWMDIDIATDEPTKHASISEASAALAKFCRVTGWPIPTIVSSGTGLHFYWPLTNSIDVVTWRNYWPHLIAVAKYTGLKLDVAASNKATQVMRPPGSTHRKDPANPRTVEVVREADPSHFDYLFSCLDDCVQANNLPLVQAHTPAQNTFATMMQAAGFTYTAPVTDRDPLKVIKGCDQIRLSMTEARTEPEFRAVISTMMVLPNGRNLLHIMGKRQPMYDYDEVEGKIDALPTPPLPYTCASFDSLTPGICRTCPHRGKIKSPVTLGNKHDVVELHAPPTVQDESVPVATAAGLDGLLHPAPNLAGAPVTINDRAGAYKVDATGCWVILPNEADKEPIQICKQPVYPLKHLYKLNDAGSAEHFYLFHVDAKAPSAKLKDILISGSEAHGDYASKQFVDGGVVIKKRDNDKWFNNFMRSHIEELADTVPTEMFTSMGWQTDGDFVTGQYNVLPSGAAHRATNGREATDTARNNTMEPTGDYHEWRAAMDVFNTESQLHAQLCIGTAYAAPLFKFLGIDGLLLSLHGKSGIGKSAIQDAVGSVWGDPAGLTLKAPGTSNGSSQVAMLRHVGMMNSLPVMLDELSNLDPAKISDFVHGLSSGKEKDRLRPGGKGEYNLTKGLTWKTAFLSSSNAAIADKLAEGKSDCVAERYRLFELTNLKLLRTETFVEDSEKLRGLKQNYGHAGLTYARYLQTNIEKIPDWIQAEIAWLTKKVDAVAEERFWVQGMAAWLVGLAISYQAGLHSFDLKRLREYVIEQFKAQREGISESKNSTATSFAEMINDMLPHAVIVDQENELIQGMTARIPKSGKLYMRIDIASRVGEVTTSEVKNWCHRHSIGLAELKASGVESGVLSEGKDKATQVTLGRGVKELAGGGRVQVYQFNIPNDSIALMREQLKEKEQDP